MSGSSAAMLIGSGWRRKRPSTAYFKHELECTGMKKTCVYDYLGDDIYKTIDCVKLCPLTIEVDD